MKTKPLNLEEIRKLVDDFIQSTVESGEIDIVVVKSGMIKIIDEAEQRINSALQGLTKDISELHSEIIGRNDDNFPIAPFEFVKKIEVEKLIKKWFGEVNEKT